MNQDKEMSRKRSGDQGTNSKAQKPRFAGANHNVFEEDADFVFRDNSPCLEQLSEQVQVLFLRPTQMGKTSLLTLADMMYNKRSTQCPAVEFQPPDARSMFVLSVDFLRVDAVGDASAVDDSVKGCVVNAVNIFLQNYPELQDHYKEPMTGAGAGTYLEAAAEAVANYGLSDSAKGKQSLLVLIDEYDKPVRDLLIGFLGKGEEARWEQAKEMLANYRSFFKSCKAITGSRFVRDHTGLRQGKVWVTGVLPIALKVISDFNPEVFTFRPEFDDAIGLLDADVDDMLEKVDGFFPFADDQEKRNVRAAICKLANRHYFVSDTPLYHTRVVNSIMNALLSKKSRRLWLENLSMLPFGTHFQEIPHTVYDVIQKQIGLRKIARALTLNKEITSTLRQSLDLGDVLRNPMDEADYLTLLVHLGIASVRRRHGQTVFQATSTFFRIPFFSRLLRNSLQPLFDADSLQTLYQIGATQIEEFMHTLPKSGMASLVRWAEDTRRNKILELHFQGFLIGALADSLWFEDVETSQEDVTPSGRTDVRIAGERTLLLLELKQKSASTSPTTREMDTYQEQLHEYMAELVQIENKTTDPRRVAGFVVVMFNNGKSFSVQRTTYSQQTRA